MALIELLHLCGTTSLGPVSYHFWRKRFLTHPMCNNVRWNSLVRRNAIASALSFWFQAVTGKRPEVPTQIATTSARDAGPTHFGNPPQPGGAQWSTSAPQEIYAQNMLEATSHAQTSMTPISVTRSWHHPFALSALSESIGCERLAG